MKKLFVASMVFCVFLLLSPLISAVVQSSNQTWNVQTVDTFPQQNGIHGCSLALDSNDYPHIIYFGTAGSFYARWTGSAWSIQTAPGIEENQPLVLDSNGNPHISYWGYKGVEYASWNSSGWNIQTVDTKLTIDLQLGADGDNPSLALDPQGNPHISYVINPVFFNASLRNYQDNSSLKYASWTGLSWDIQTIARPANPGTCLVFDSNGNPHISYSTDTGFKYASWNGSAWKIQTVDTTGGYPSLALDAKGNPHISYNFWYYVETDGYNISTSDLKYATWNGSAWNTQIIEKNSPGGLTVSSLALDANGNPHISYAQGHSGGLTYASWNGSNWNIQTVPQNSYSEGSPSLALDSAGNPHISYSTGRTLEYASFGTSTETGINIVYPIIVVVIVVIVAVLLLLRKSRVKKSKNTSSGNLPTTPTS